MRISILDGLGILLGRDLLMLAIMTYSLVLLVTFSGVY